MAPPPVGFVGREIKRLPGLLIPLVWLAAFIIAIGLIQAGRYLIDMLVAFVKATVGRIPVIGGVFSKKANQLRVIVDKHMTALAAKCESRVAPYFRDLGRVIVDAANDFIDEAIAGAVLIAWLTKKIVLQKVPHRLDRLERLPRKIPSTVKQIVIRQTRVLRRTVVRVERIVIKQGKVFIHTIPRALPRWVHALRRRVRNLERGHARQAKRLTTIEHKLVGRRFDGLVNRSLNRLGLGWLRCTSVTRMGRELCRNGGSWLPDLLANIVPVFLLADLCGLTRLANLAANEAEPIVRDLVVVANALADCSDFGPPAPLPLNAARVPTPVAPLVLV